MWKTLTSVIVTSFLLSLIRTSESLTGKKLLLLCIDGFRSDYFSRDGLYLPGFEEVFARGVKAEYMIPDFPTNTFPNMYSAVTGLHAQNHNIVGNIMYDNDLGWYIYGNSLWRKSKWYEGGQPVWSRAESQNKRAYMFDWPACDITSAGIKTTYCRTNGVVYYPDQNDVRRALDDGIDLFQRDCADIVGIYTVSVDKAGHEYGPDSHQTNAAIKEVDETIVELLHKLKNNGLEEHVNVMIFSDHGMTLVPKGNIVELKKLINNKNVLRFVDGGGLVGIFPKPGKFDEVYDDVKKLQGEKLTVYKKEELPERLKYRESDRVAPIVVISNINWFTTTPLWSGDFFVTPGGHGFDNEAEEMRTIFAAFGPNFKQGVITPPVEIVELYQVMCDVLGIQAAPNDGTGDLSAQIVIPDVETEVRTNDPLAPLTCIPKSDVKLYSIVTLTSASVLYVMSLLGVM